MQSITRKQFFKNFTAPKVPVSTLVVKQSPTQITNDEKQSNGLGKANTGLAQYTGTWSNEQIYHLLRRTLIGVSKEDFDYFKSKSMNQIVDEMIAVSPTSPEPPVNYYTNEYFDGSVSLGNTWVSAPENATLSFARRNSFKAWWFNLMINQERNIREKMTLFWHNHFATESNIVLNAKYTYETNRLFRANCVGNFKQLARLMATDCGMLVYLNGEKNTNTAPDENFGRELQELFTVGKDLKNHYTEDDVKAAARVMTGWRNNTFTNTNVSYFDPFKHDTNDKHLSSFYNNAVIKGKTGAAGATELDELIDVIFNQEEVSKFICRKIYRYFVYYQIDENVENNVIIPLASIFRSNNYDIKIVLQTLFKSEHFYDTLNVGCNIKPPIDYLVGIIKCFSPMPPASNVVQSYYHALFLQQSCILLGQNIGDPPNVAGWPAYWQSPQYQELWINSDLYTYRNQISDGLIYSGYDKENFKLILDLPLFIGKLNKPEDPNEVINQICALFFANNISVKVKSNLKESFLLAGQSYDSYWTSAWNDYKANPSDTNKKQTVIYKLQALFKHLFGLEEYQLY
jgi:uncharacterized protein (DUF1800 family)